MDDKLWVPISALQHYRFCPRQCALIHVESIWEENRLTAEGRVLHDRVHASGKEKRDGVIIIRGMWVCSQRHGLSGIADVVEFHPPDGDTPGITLPGERGRWRPFPVEYKRGRPKKNRLDEEQLAAQALCLAEMFSIPVSSGALYYGSTKRRKDVDITADMLQLVAELSNAVRSMIENEHTPASTPGKHCESCSLADSCLPHATSKSVNAYYRTELGFS